MRDMTFVWDKGHTSLNDNGVKVLKAHGIDFWYDECQNLRARVHGRDIYVDYRKIDGDLFEVGEMVERWNKVAPYREFRSL